MKSIKYSKSALELKELLEKRIVFLDGAMGTIIQKENLKEEDFRGDIDELKNCDLQLLGNNDILNLTRPDIIKKIHKDYYLAGSDIITLNTFGANKVVQKEYNLSESLIEQINKSSYELGISAAKEASEITGKRYFIAGSIGPMNKSSSIACDVNDASKRAVSFDELVEAYMHQMKSLWEVDLFLLETSFDTLNVKSAIFAYLTLANESQACPAIAISMTVSDASGRILSGQTIDAFYTSIEHAKPLFVGLNCSLGAEKMSSYIQNFDRIAKCYTHCYPNAGLPNALSEYGYDQVPEDTAKHLYVYANAGLLNVIGGCCGTTPKHIEAIVKKCQTCKPRQIKNTSRDMNLAGLEKYTLPEKNAEFTFVGERTNVMGSAIFKKLIKNQDFEKAISIARAQVENGANLIDINFDEAMLDSKACMRKFLNLLGADPEISKVPFMIDSSDWGTLEEGLKCIQGKAIVNSISLKSGESEFLRQASLIKKYGASVIVMAFDEEGQASNKQDKIRICKRAYKLLVDELDFPPEDIVFDVNVLTIATGMSQHSNYAIDFIEAVKYIKENLAYARTSAGVSNVSFALRGNNPVREAMHAVFLYHARLAGLDMAIVNAGMICDYESMDKHLKKLIEDVVLNKSPEATQNLLANIDEFTNGQNKEKEVQEDLMSWQDKLKIAFVKGNEDKIQEIVKHYLDELKDPLKVIEEPLMEAMKYVGVLFSEGKMFLPQVVKSARVMKKAVSYLEPHMDKQMASKGPKVVLATVKGDVHDIGKNIVSVVLSCNGYNVVDLGVMVEASDILAEAKDAQIVGLSALITPSLDEMIKVVKLFEEEGLKVPIMLGGATTSHMHTAVKIAPEYSSLVLKVDDASVSAGICSKIIKEKDIFDIQTKTHQEILRNKFEQESQNATELESFESAKTLKLKNTRGLLRSTEFGLKSLDVKVQELKDLIPWHIYFKTWQIKTARKLEDLNKLDELKDFFKDSLEVFKNLEKSATLKCIYKNFKAQSIGEDVELYEDDKHIQTLNFVRSQKTNSAGKCLSIADFVSDDEKDELILFATSVNSEALLNKYKEDNDDYRYIITQSLSDILAEALALYLQKEVFDVKCNKKQVGGRYAVGYTSYPDHMQKAKFEELLQMQKNLSIELTQSYMLKPVSSVCGVWIANENAKYFDAKVQEDQISDYANRVQKDLNQVKKFIGF